MALKWNPITGKLDKVTTIGSNIGGTDGYILFSDAGKLAEDSGLFWDDTNDRLGIGTTTPDDKQQIVGGNLSLDQDKGLAWNSLDDGTYTGSSYVRGSARSGVRIGGIGTKFNDAKWINFDFDTTGWTVQIDASDVIEFRQDLLVGSDTALRYGSYNAGWIGYSTQGDYHSLFIGTNNGASGRAHNIVIADLNKFTYDMGLPYSNDPTMWFYGDNSNNNNKTGRLQYVSASDYFSIDAQTNDLVLQENGGNVGIGTTTPDEKLEVTGNIRTTTDNDKYYSGTAKDMSIFYDGTDGNIKTDEVSPSDLLLTTGAEKTLELQTVVWDDLRTPSNNSKKVPGKEAKDQTYKGGVVLKFEDNQDQAVAFNAQLPHKYKEGEDIEFHLHLVYPTATVGNTRWVFTYSWANIGDTHPAETTVTTIIASPNEVDNHQLAEIAATISGVGKTVSSMLICSVTREGTDGTDTLGQDVYLTELDFHYPIDTIGSRTEDTK